MKKYLQYIVLFCVMLNNACGNSHQKESSTDGKLQYSPQVNLVDVITLTRQNFNHQLLSNGKLSATRKSALNFNTSGVISSIYVVNGQRVSRGAKIAELDHSELDLSLKSAQISMEKAELDLLDQLAGQGYKISDTMTIPEDVKKIASIRSGYTSASNSLEKTHFALRNSVLRAPFSGRIADLKLKQYDKVSSEAFCTIIDDSSFDVDFTVMESEYSFLELGLAVRVIPYSNKDKQLIGKIMNINPAVDKNGQVSVRAKIDGGNSLVDGMNVKVIVEKPVLNKLVVPRSAVVVRDNLDVLFTYTDDGKAHWTYVNIIMSNEDSYVVEANTDRGSTLLEGDKVIISGNLNLADDSSVVLKK